MKRPVLGLNFLTVYTLRNLGVMSTGFAASFLSVYVTGLPRTFMQEQGIYS